MTEITIGGDPEFFVVDSDGKFRGAWEFFPGDKNNPYPLNGGSVQVDGFAVEIGIDPTTSVDEFDEKVVSLVDQCKHFVPNGYKFIFEPLAEFDKEYFKNAPQVHKMIGCSPSWDCSLRRKQESPQELANSQTRYAGGHIHLGFGNFDIEDQIEIHWLDHFALNLYSTIGSSFDYIQTPMHPSFSSSYLRRSNYLCSTSIRHKKYGVELRRPAPYWANPEEKDYRKGLMAKVQEKTKELIGA